MEIYGIKPYATLSKKKPYIRNNRYVVLEKSGGKRRRLAKNQTNRGYYKVGYPVLNVRGDRVFYTIWEGKGGVTFQEACDFLEVKLMQFQAQVWYYEKHGKEAR